MREIKEVRKTTVIKGWRVGEGNLKENFEKFLREKIDYKALIETAWKSDAVVVAKVNRECKIEIMKKRKGLLAGIRIFIEKDLFYEERKRQELLNKWVKEEREESMNVRIGRGRIVYEDLWYKWEKRRKLEKQSNKMKDRLGRPSENESRKKCLKFYSNSGMK